MIQSSPILSICIPTNGRIEVTRLTLQSIYAHVRESDMNEFEVVVSDNSPDSSSSCFVGEFPYPNFRYHASNCPGFLNSYEVLSKANGRFLKLQNNTSCFREFTLAKLIADLKTLEKDRPVIYYSNGFASLGTVRSFATFDEFLYNLSYLASASPGFGIWRDDFEKVRNIALDPMFPQTSLLLAMSDKRDFVLDDTSVFISQTVAGKGGYNIFKVFAVDFLGLILSHRESCGIGERTIRRIKRDTLYKCLSARYLKTVVLKTNKFDYSNLTENMLIHYSRFEYYSMIAYSFLIPVSILWHRIRMKFFHPASAISEGR